MGRLLMLPGAAGSTSPGKRVSCSVRLIPVAVEATQDQAGIMGWSELFAADWHSDDLNSLW